MDLSDYATDHDELLSNIKADENTLVLPYYIGTGMELPKGVIQVYIVGAGFSKRACLYLYCIKVKSSNGFSMKSRFLNRIEYDRSLHQKLKTCISLVAPNTEEEHKIVDYINA